MNKVILIGNLTKEPEYKATSNGKEMTHYTLAVNRRYTDENGNKVADFIPCVAWGKLANLVANYLHKGDKCAVTGSIQTRSYQAQDGSKRYVTEVVADEVEFLPSGNKASGSAPAPATPDVPDAPQLAPDDGDLPF